MLCGLDDPETALQGLARRLVTPPLPMRLRSLAATVARSAEDRLRALRIVGAPGFRSCGPGRRHHGAPGLRGPWSSRWLRRPRAAPRSRLARRCWAVPGLSSKRAKRRTVQAASRALGRLLPGPGRRRCDARRGVGECAGPALRAAGRGRAGRTLAQRRDRADEGCDPDGRRAVRARPGTDRSCGPAARNSRTEPVGGLPRPGARATWRRCPPARPRCDPGTISCSRRRPAPSWRRWPPRSPVGRRSTAAGATAGSSAGRPASAPLFAPAASARPWPPR